MDALNAQWMEKWLTSSWMNGCCINEKIYDTELVMEDKYNIQLYLSLKS